MSHQGKGISSFATTKEVVGRIETDYETKFG